MGDLRSRQPETSAGEPEPATPSEKLHEEHQRRAVKWLRFWYDLGDSTAPEVSALVSLLDEAYDLGRNASIEDCGDHLRAHVAEPRPVEECTSDAKPALDECIVCAEPAKFLEPRCRAHQNGQTELRTANAKAPETDWRASYQKVYGERDHYRERWEDVSRALRDVVDDCCPPERSFSCTACGCHHPKDIREDGDSTCSVSKALRLLDAPELRTANPKDEK